MRTAGPTRTSGILRLGQLGLSLLLVSALSLDGVASVAPRHAAAAAPGDPHDTGADWPGDGDGPWMFEDEVGERSRAASAPPLGAAPYPGRRDTGPALAVPRVRVVGRAAPNAASGRSLRVLLGSHTC